MKRALLANVFAILFVLAAALVWFVCAWIFAEPFRWASLDPAWMRYAAFLAGAIALLIVIASILSLLRPSSEYAFAVFVVGGAIAFAFLPVSVFTAAAAMLFAVGFHFFEKGVQETFHSFVHVDFGSTYRKTIPTLLSMIALVVAVGQYQASRNAIDSFRYEVPASWVNTAADIVASQSGAGETADISEQRIQEELSRYDTAGNEKQLELMRSLVTQALRDEVEEARIVAERSIRERIREMARNEIERQINGFVDTYRPYLPLISAFVIFSTVNLFSVPVLLVSIALTVFVIAIMKRLRIVSVIKVKQEVERLAL
jgi:hypothetical protein